MKAKWLLVPSIALLISPLSAKEKCTFKIEGKVKVKSQFDEVLDQKLPLKNILVKAHGASGTSYLWNKWGQTRTDANGYFKIVKEKKGSACKKGRYVKVEVKFDSSDFELRHNHATSALNKVKDYKVYQSINKKDPGTISLFNLTFENGGNHSLGDTIPRSHGDIWMALTKLKDHVKGFGSDYAFNKKFALKYPHNGVVGDAAESSYANPHNQVVYIIKNSLKDHFNIETIYHEAGHIWAYQHDQGNTGLVTAVVFGGGTHGTVRKSHVAFHEGFAEYFMEKMKEDIFGSDAPIAYSRAYLRELGLNNLDDVEHHDYGWHSLFKSLTMNNLEDFNFSNTSDTVTSFGYYASEDFKVSSSFCDIPNLNVKNVLKTFLANEAAGYKKNIKKSEMTIDGYMARAKDILNKMDSDHQGNYMELIDPTSDKNPKDMFCSTRVPRF